MSDSIFSSRPDIPKKEGHKDADRPAPKPKPPRLTLPPKTDSLARRIRNLEAIGKGNFTGNAIASYLALPGLVGFWPMSSVGKSSGDALDLSRQDRTLSYTGNPAYSYFNNLIAYIDLDGTGDYLTRADEAGVDVTGAETIYQTGARGLTFGGWFWADSVAATFGILSKNTDTGNQRSWVMLYNQAIPAVQFAVSSGGTSHDFVATGTDIAIETWYFLVGRFTPSTEISIFINSDKSTNTTSPVASIFNSTAAFQVGAYNAGTSLLNGRASLCFLCANALSDALIVSLYQQTRVLFGV